MKLEQIHIDSFGTLHTFDLAMQPGVNILQGRNETGKSTLCTFLTYMLYGLPKGERERYISWESGSLGGYLILTVRDKRYRIERSVSCAGRETLRIIDLSTNTQCMKGEIPGEGLLGLPASLFVKTAYVSQADGTAVGGGDLSEAIGNLLFSGDEAVNTQRVLKRLDEARIPLLHKNRKGGEIYTLEAECDRLREQLEHASACGAEMIYKESSLEELNATLAAGERKYESLGKQIACQEATALIAQFDRLHQAETLRDNARKKIKVLDENNRFDGFLPDSAYPERLSAAMREEERAEQARRVAEDAFQNAVNREQNVDEREAFLQRLAANGGGASILAHFCDAMASYRKYRRMAFWTLFLIIPAILFFRRAALAKAEAMRILDTYHCADETQLSALVERAAVDASRLAAYDRNVKEQASQRDLCCQNAAHAGEEVRMLTALWGKNDPSEACRDARRYLSERAAACAEEEKAASLAEGLALSLHGREEAMLRARLEALTEEGVCADSCDITAVRREYDYLTHALHSQREKKNEIEKSLIALRATSVSPAALQDRLNAAEKRLHQLRRRYSALMLAYDSLSSAALRLREGISPRLSAAAGAMMSHVTEGKYRTIGVGRDMSMEYTAQGEGGRLSTHSVSVLSAGTQDAAYVALRLSLLQLLCRNAMPPVIFDESFARLDDLRLRAMLSMLASYAREGHQVILLTSSGRDALAAGDDPIFHRISL